jgi:hypothetical protein
LNSALLILAHDKSEEHMPRMAKKLKIQTMVLQKICPLEMP